MFYYDYYMRGCFYQDLATIPTLQQQKAQLIDLRSSTTFEYAHIPGFINIPYSQIYQQLQYIDKRYPVYFLCDNGQKSEIVASDLCAHGYQAYSFIGGYNHYHYQPDQSLY